jgi:hypothetical protein
LGYTSILLELVPKRLSLQTGNLSWSALELLRAFLMRRSSLFTDPRRSSATSISAQVYAPALLELCEFAGVDGRFRDVYSFVRFLDRVLEDMRSAKAG